METAIIIVTWNGLVHLEKCLPSVMQQSYNSYKIYLIDNNSKDNTIHFVRKSYPTIKIIKLDKNYGFAEANNIGIRAAFRDKTKYIVTLNNDTIVDKDWLKHLVHAAKTTSAGFYSSKIYFLKNDKKTKIINTVGDIYYKDSHANSKGVWKEDNGQYDKQKEIFGACACAALYKSDMLKKIGLFDGKFFAYYEDIDLAFRAQLAGYKCLFVPEAVIWHKFSATGSKIADYYCARNQLFVIVKNYPILLLIRNFLPIMRYYITDTVNSIKIRNTKRMRGRLVGMLLSPLYLQNRFSITRKVKIRYIQSILK